LNWRESLALKDTTLDRAASRQEFYPSPSASTTKVGIETTAVRAFPTVFWEITPKSELRGKIDK